MKKLFGGTLIAVTIIAGVLMSVLMALTVVGILAIPFIWLGLALPGMAGLRLMGIGSTGAVPVRIKGD